MFIPQVQYIDYQCIVPLEPFWNHGYKKKWLQEFQRFKIQNSRNSCNQVPEKRLQKALNSSILLGTFGTLGTLGTSVTMVPKKVVEGFHKKIN